MCIRDHYSITLEQKLHDLTNQIKSDKIESDCKSTQICELKEKIPNRIDIQNAEKALLQNIIEDQTQKTSDLTNEFEF
jgi:hypothetical protein